MKSLSKLTLAFLLTTNLLISDLKASVQEHLASYDVTMQVARDFIMNNYQGSLQLVFDTCKLYDVNNDMIAEILADDFPGLTGETVASFFDANGFNSDELSFDGFVYHNGYLYEIITSPISGRKWLDRNVGASEVCTKSRDDYDSKEEFLEEQEACLGDLFQWGRLADGHEKTDSTTIDTRAISVNEAGVNFILNPDTPSDWVENTTQDSNNVDDDASLRVAQWNNTDGTSICPEGYKVPTIYELTSDTIYYEGTINEGLGAVKVIDLDSAYKNFLKLSPAGWKHVSDGTLYDRGDFGMLWSSTSTDNIVSSINFSNNQHKIGVNIRGTGAAVRCIDDNLTPTANAGENQSVIEGVHIGVLEQ